MRGDWNEASRGGVGGSGSGGGLGGAEGGGVGRVGEVGRVGCAEGETPIGGSSPLCPSRGNRKGVTVVVGNSESAMMRFSGCVITSMTTPTWLTHNHPAARAWS